MPYTLSVESKGSYLHATVTGQNGRETVIGYFEEIRAACRSRDCYRVLVKERRKARGSASPSSSSGPRR